MATRRSTKRALPGPSQDHNSGDVSSELDLQGTLEGLPKQQKAGYNPLPNVNQLDCERALQFMDDDLTTSLPNQAPATTTRSQDTTPRTSPTLRNPTQSTNTTFAVQKEVTPTSKMEPYRIEGIVDVLVPPAYTENVPIPNHHLHTTQLLYKNVLKVQRVRDAKSSIKDGLPPYLVSNPDSYKPVFCDVTDIRSKLAMVMEEYKAKMRDLLFYHYNSVIKHLSLAQADLLSSLGQHWNNGLRQANEAAAAAKSNPSGATLTYYPLPKKSRPLSEPPKAQESEVPSLLTLHVERPKTNQASKQGPAPTPATKSTPSVRSDDSAAALASDLQQVLQKYLSK